jgi:outer membrane receptor for ferrienterochelin and colicins
VNDEVNTQEALQLTRSKDRRWTSIGLGVLLALALGAPATLAGAAPAEHVHQLGELSIKELMELEVDSVYGASRYVQKSAQAPSSISVVTADDIGYFGARTLGDVLNAVRGLYVPNDRNYTYLGIRGFQRPNDYNTRVLVLVDGHRMNDNVYDLGSVGRESMVDVDLIERVEVIRGPSSSIYGSSAFFGVINVVTKRGEPYDGIEASAEAGTLGMLKSRLTFGTKFDNGVEWLISGSRFSSDGHDTLYYPEFDQRISADPRAANDGVAERRDGEDAASFFSTARFSDFTVSAFWSDRTKEVPTASYETVFNDPREETFDTRSYLDARYDHAFDESLWLQARAFYDEYVYSGNYPYEMAEPGLPSDIVLSKDETIGRWVGTELQLTSKVGERHTVIVGGEYRKNLREYQLTYEDTDPLDYWVSTDRSSHTLGLFAQTETALRSDLLLTFGVRYDRHPDELASTLNPRVALIYNPSATGTLKAMYGEAFRSPNPYERYYYEDQVNRPALQPETIDTLEIAYEKEIRDNLRLTLAGYQYDVENLLSQAATVDDLIYYDNLDGAEATGVEVEVERTFDSGGSLRASYALQEAVDAQTRQPLSNSPRHMAKLQLRVPLLGDRLSAGVEMQYVGAATTLRGNRADDFVVTNVTLYRKPVAKGLELSATIYNLFDGRYAYPGAEDHAQDLLEQDGRMVQGKLTYRF